MKKLFLFILVLLAVLRIDAQLDSLKPQLKTPESHRYTEALYATAGEKIETPEYIKDKKLKSQIIAS